jgi:ethanolamine ammonia-lyase small subunit
VTDPLAALRASTRARVALGRAGDALPTSELLELRAAHAAARDAVHVPLGADAVAGTSRPSGRTSCG